MHHVEIWKVIQTQATFEVENFSILVFWDKVVWYVVTSKLNIEIDIIGKKFFMLVVPSNNWSKCFPLNSFKNFLNNSWIEND